MKQRLPKIATADWSAWGARWIERETVYVTCQRHRARIRRHVEVCQSCRHQMKCTAFRAAVERSQAA